MENAIGTLVIFAIAGCFFSDQTGKKVAPWLLAVGLLLEFLWSPEFTIVLILARFAGVAMLVGAAIVGFFRRLKNGQRGVWGVRNLMVPYRRKRSP